MTYYEGPIVDAHHHLFWDWQNNYHWMAAPMKPMIFGEDWTSLKRDYLIGNLLQDFAPHYVVKSVHVQANFDFSRPVDETRGLQMVADKHEYPQGIVAFANMTDPDVDKVLDEHLYYENVCGIRHQAYWHKSNPDWRWVDREDLCLSDDFRRGLDWVRKKGLTFDWQGFATQFDQLVTLARAFPDLKFCLEHAGMLTNTNPANVADHAEALKKLLPLDNVFIKVSGLNTFSRRLDQEMIQIVLKMVLEIFGPDRCFFGSNYPVERMWTSYEGYISAHKKALADRSDTVCQKLFHDTAISFYEI
ncbi:MAG: amidohydrolase family protein [SAR324 cluster bacterium]|nr:amidohydrolase family protein [SAR324 cluster bacterium]